MIYISGRSEDGTVWAEVTDGQIIGWASHKALATALSSEQKAEQLIADYNDGQGETRWVWKLTVVAEGCQMSERVYVYEVETLPKGEDRNWVSYALVASEEGAIKMAAHAAERGSGTLEVNESKDKWFWYIRGGSNWTAVAISKREVEK